MCLSFCGPVPSPSFSLVFGDGDEALRVTVGTARELDSLKGMEINAGGGGNAELDGGVMSTLRVAEVVSDAEPLGDGSLLVEDDAIDSSGWGADGVLNSTGLTRGVAWMLVMSFARSQ